MVEAYLVDDKRIEYSMTFDEDKTTLIVSYKGHADLPELMRRFKQQYIYHFKQVREEAKEEFDEETLKCLPTLEESLW